MIANRGLVFLLAAIVAAVAMTLAFDLPWIWRQTWEWDVLPILAVEVLAAFCLTIIVAAFPWLAVEKLAYRAGRKAGFLRLAAALLVAILGNGLLVLFARAMGEGDPDQIGLAEAWWRFLPMTMSGGVVGGLSYVLLGERAR